MLKAIILAGGMGKRLRPITDYIPKPLVPIKNIPIIEWQIRYLKKFGVKDVVICTGYKKEFIENYLSVQDMQVNIQFSIEDTPLGTGGAIKRAGTFIDEESFLVINGDVITDIDLTTMMAMQTTKNCIASINLQTRFGILETNNEDIITGFREKPDVSNLWMNAGIYRLQKAILPDLPDVGDIEKTTFPAYAQENRLKVVKFENVRWHSIDSFKDIEECASHIEEIIK